MPGKTVVVIADLDRDRRNAHVQALSDAGMACTETDNGADALDRCRESAPHVAVVESSLPRKNGFEVLKALKEDARTAGVKVVLVIEEDDAEGQERGRLCGADVLLSRPFSPAALAEAVRQAESTAEEATGGGSISNAALEGVLDELEGRARAENPLLEHISDPLTGLFNQAYSELKLAEEVKKVRRFYHPMTCVVVHIDAQASLDNPDNEQEVRRIINETAGILLCESRDIDHLARFSGHEFVCILPHTDTPGGVAMAERILVSVANRDFHLPDSDGPITASAGIATFTGTGMDAAEDLLTRAREALSTSSQWGGNRCTVWTPDQAPAIE